MVRFDPKLVTPVEWLGIGAAAVVLVTSFAPWFSFNERDAAVFDGIGLDASPNGWAAGPLALVGVLLLVATAAIVLLPHLGTKMPGRSLSWLAAALIGGLLIVLSRTSYVPDDLEAVAAFPGLTIWYHVTVTAAVAAVAAAALNLRITVRRG